MQFTETQRFRQWWLWLLLLLAVVFIVLRVNYRITIVDGVVVSKHLSWQISRIALAVFVVILFLLSALQVIINEQGITYRFYPLQVKYRNIQWEELDKAYVRTYKPLSEFRGWGIRFGPNARALNISGNIGLQLVFKNGRQLLIGTNKRDELESFMNELYAKGLVKNESKSSNTY